MARNINIEIESPSALFRRARLTQPRDPSGNIPDDTSVSSSSSPVSSSNMPHDYKDFLPLTSRIILCLTHYRIPNIFIMCMLAYHLFVHLWIGWQSGGPLLFQGFMYFSNYFAVSVSYWIMVRQHKTWLNGSSSSSSDKNVIVDQHFEYHPELFHHINKSIHHFPGRTNNRYGERYLDKIRSTCRWWENFTKLFYLIWLIPSFINIGRRVYYLSIDKFESEDNLHESPWGLYGFYNLTGQFLAAFCIIPVSTMLVTGFYQIRMMIQFWVHNIRQSRDGDGDNIYSYRDENNARKDYLHIQACLVNFSYLWSTPILATFVLSTQVIISNLVLIYKLTSFGVFNYSEHCGDTCDFPITYPIIWLVVGCGIFILMLMLVSGINSVGEKAREAFVYAQDCDYIKIGYGISPRQRWLDYLDSNPLQFKVSGLVINNNVVVKTLYPLSVGMGSLFFSSLLE